MQILRVGFQGGAKRDERSLEMLLLEFGESPIEIESGELRIQRVGALVGGNRLLVFSLAGEDQAQAGERGGVFRVGVGDFAPSLFGFGEVALLFEGLRCCWRGSLCG